MFRLVSTVAKHTKRNRNFVAIPISGTLNLLTLANETVLVDDVFGGNLTEDLYVMSVDLNAEIINLTAGEGDPHTCGFAHGDYTVTEIKEALEVQLLGPGSKIEQERARRLIRKTGIYVAETEAQTKLNLKGRAGDGQIRTKIKFMVQSGKTLSMWVFNESGAALTTGASVRWQGTVYGRWVI